VPYKDPQQQKEYWHSRYVKLSQTTEVRTCRDCNTDFETRWRGVRCGPCKYQERKKRDPDGVAAKNRRGNRRRYEINLDGLIALKEKNPCPDCGQRYPHYVMEFDHVPDRGKKLHGVGTLLVKEPLSSPRVQAELAKGEFVCANCHNARTWRRKEEARQNVNGDHSMGQHGERE
jgi:hypothetical protein